MLLAQYNLVTTIILQQWNVIDAVVQLSSCPLKTKPTNKNKTNSSYANILYSAIGIDYIDLWHEREW